MHESRQEFWIHFSISRKEHNRYIKCLETWVGFCHNVLKLISHTQKNHKPFSSLMYNNKYNFGLLKNILGKSEEEIME